MKPIESNTKISLDAGERRVVERSKTKRNLASAISLVLGALPFIALPSQALSAPARSADQDVAGFPSWYEDANGIRVGLCYNPNDVNCVAPASATYDPNQPLSFPGNYPDELFYSAADSALVVVDDSASCPTFQRPAPVAGAGSRIHMALEAAFLNGTLTPGDQMVFGRLRVVSRAGNGLCPGAWYTFRTPYGPITLQTDQNAEIQGAVASAATNDVGCAPGPTAPCNFDLAFGAPVLGAGLLHQVNATGASTAAPGYLGNGVALGLVTGGLNDFNRFEVVKWPAGSVPASHGVGVNCTDVACEVLGSTEQFAVAAKLAGPLGSKPALDFGGQALGSTSAAKTIVLTNLGSGPLGQDATTLTRFDISGANASDFAVSSHDCPAPALARDAGCNVAVTFAPASNGYKTAVLNVYGSNNRLLHQVTLNGTGIIAGQTPAVSSAPADGNVNFGAVRLTTAGDVKGVTITNTGTAPLSAIPNLSGSQAFSIVYDTCSPAFVPAGGQCSVGLRFIPSVAAPVSATLRIATNAPSGTVTYVASGHGTGGIAAVSQTLNAINTFPEWYQDETGLRVGQCDDPANTLCIAAPVTGTPEFPSNYPDEWFYYLAQSAPMDVHDPQCNIQPGPIFVEAGMEAAFLGPIGPNQGITFGRLRIVSRGGLCPNTSYKLTHPYGESIIATDDRGNIKPTAGTTDIGCLGAPCDYSIALSAPVFEGFLKQTVRPDGYLGDPLAPSTVTGAPYIDQDGQPANYFKVERLDSAGVALPIGLTTQFGVSGRLVGPMQASPAQQDFGSAEVGVSSQAVTHTITFTNDGPFPVALAASPLEVIGSHANDFTVVSTTCTSGMQLARAQFCTADVVFEPLFTGARSASLRIKHSGGNNPLGVALTGIGNSPAGTAAISASLAALKFTDLHIGLHSESATLTLSNIGGQAALLINRAGLNLSGPFVINEDHCSGVRVLPGSTCDLKIQFQPVSVGAFAGTLTVASNAASGVLSIPVSGKGTDTTPRAAAFNNEASMPNWYQDGNGVRVEPCLAQDGNCVLLADATFDPLQPVVFGTNFPGESFYNIADSEVISTPADPTCGAVGGLALLRVATEAAFPTLPPAPGGLTLFNRIRIVAGGLCPNTRYLFTHPYGVSALTTDAAGNIRPKDGTIDNPNVLASAPISPGLIQWDKNVAPAAPTGYLGDARTLHPIVGSQYRPTPTSEPANYFKIARASDGKVIGETKLFTVAGRIPGPIVSSLDGKVWGTWEIGRTSDIQAFTITNLSDEPVSNFNVALAGTHANQFSISSNTCVTATRLLSDQSCVIQVQFNPTVASGAGVKAATLTVAHNAVRSPLNIALSGTAIATQTPALAVTPATVAFGTVVVGNTSANQVVTIRNSGTGDLLLKPITLGGTNPSQYVINGTTCSSTAALKAGTACTVTVAFKPLSGGSKPTTLAVQATDAVTSGGHVPVTIAPVNVSLTGTGGQGTISLSASTLAVSARAGATGTVSVTLTNNGTAPLSLNAAPFSFTAVSTNNPVPLFSATQTGCTNLAVGRRCTATVTFRVPAGTRAATVYSVNMAIASNASNAPTVRVNGTVR